MNRLTEQFFTSSSGVFSLSDVAVTIDGTDFSRHGLIKRAISAGEILNLRRGLYCLTPKYQKKPLSVYSLVERIYGPSYISFETALSYHGWIPEAVYTCACASFGNSKDFDTPLGMFSYKRVVQNVFFFAVERLADESGNVFFMASPAKALADYVYARQLKWTSVSDAIGSLRIEPDDILSVEAPSLNALLNNYTNGRVRRFLTGWLKEVQS